MYRTIVMDVMSRAATDGNAYIFHKSMTIAAGANASALLVTGADDYIHMINKEIVATGELITVQFIEDVTATNGASEAVIFNKNRNSSNTSGVIVYTASTGITGGTEIDRYLMPGSDDNKGGGGDLYSNNTNMVLKPSTKYQIKITNGGDGEETILIKGGFVISNVG